MRVSLYNVHFPTSPISERLPVRYLKHSSIGVPIQPSCRSIRYAVIRSVSVLSAKEHVYLIVCLRGRSHASPVFLFLRLSQYIVRPSKSVKKKLLPLNLKLLDSRRHFEFPTSDWTLWTLDSHEAIEHMKRAELSAQKTRP
jgi:hypothetical protein